MKKQKVLFEVIVSNQCNKRCSYCKIDFYDKKLLQKVIDSFIQKLSIERNKLEYVKVNFFGGEPLLGFDKIQYFLDNANIPGLEIQYSIGTNGLLLDKYNIEFFKSKNFIIYLSIDAESRYTFWDKNINFDFEKTYINFVVRPGYNEKTYIIFDNIIKNGFKYINILPALGINWTESDLEFLQSFVFYTKKYDNKNIYYYGYYNGFGLEKQFILETDGKIYQDLDSLLWIQKQNIEFNDNLKEFIDKSSFVGNIRENNIISHISKKYNKNKIIRDVILCAKSQNLLDLYKKIDKIIK